MCSGCDSHQYERELAHQAARKREVEPIEDGLGQDAFQTLLAASYARYMLNTTRNLVGYVYGASPLIRHKRDKEQAHE